MKNFLTEFVGAFFLVLTIGLTVTANSPFAPLAIGASLMIMVYMGGHISGGHYNPAVSLGVLLAGRLAAKDFVLYVIAQTLGAFAASACVHIATGMTFAPAPGDGVGAGAAVLVEVLYTFALVIVVLNSAVAAATKGNSFYGLAIGFTIVVAAFAGGSISGGAFNPAVGMGPTFFRTMLGGGGMEHLWIYLIGPFAGGALAAGLFKVQEPAS